MDVLEMAHIGRLQVHSIQITYYLVLPTTYLELVSHIATMQGSTYPVY